MERPERLRIVGPDEESMAKEIARRPTVGRYRQAGHESGEPLVTRAVLIPHTASLGNDLLLDRLQAFEHAVPDEAVQTEIRLAIKLIEPQPHMVALHPPDFRHINRE